MLFVETFLRFLVAFFRHIESLARNINQHLALVLRQALSKPGINTIGQKQNFNAATAQLLNVRAGNRCRVVFGQYVIDLVLIFLCSFQVVVEGLILSIVTRMGCRKAQ